MKKKVLIASLFTTIMLLVPFTSISGASISELNIKDEVIEEAYPVIPDYLFEELVELINQLLLDYGDIPEVVVACNEALELIDSIIQMDIIEEICEILEIVEFLFSWFIIGAIFGFLGYWGEGNYIMALYCVALGIASLLIAVTAICIAEVLNCAWINEENQEINILKNQIGLNLQISPDSISEYDITTIQELIQSYELNGCPCKQE